MKPLYDARLPGTQPQTHALVIGVGDYPHLPKGTEAGTAPAAKTFSLKQLSSPPVSAAAIANWLLGRHSNPLAPLGSVELLISPNQYTPSKDAAKKLGSPVAPQTVLSAVLDEIKLAAERWYLRLDSHADNIGILYFCGHGLESTDRYLLPSDYGQNPLDWTEHLINFSVTYARMAKCRARTQCFFLDACRDSDSDLQKEAASRTTIGRALIGPQAGPTVGRDSQVYQAAAPGESAAGPPGKRSYFTDALITCLDGTGARPPTGAHAPVDCISLGTALRELVWRTGEETKLGLWCDVDGRAVQPKPANVHLAKAPVSVLTVISCEPSDAHALAILTVKDSQGTVRARASLDARPWRLTLPSGRCEVQIAFDDSAPYVADKVPALALPPLFDPQIHISRNGHNRHPRTE